MSLYPKSKILFEQSKAIMPGGVSSPVRAFGSVGGTPPFISHAKGAYLWDVDDNKYIDYVGTWGPAILGHAHPKVVAALIQAINNGTSFGAPTELELKLALMIKNVLPSMEMLRFVNSGTEATMSAIRLARGFTKRNKILKFEGCYHGHADSLLVKAGSGSLTFGEPTSAGIISSTVSETLVCTFNDTKGFTQIMKTFGKEIAAVIIEPIAGNMGCVLPANGFLQTIRDETKKYGALLIFDEVITGFRVCFGGAQIKFNIQPDITCLGKIIGGGLPVGAYGGKSEIMEHISPTGDVYQAGTLSGNPLAMTAGITTIEILSQPNFYEQLETLSTLLTNKISNALTSHNIPNTINQCASMWSVFFTDEKVFDFNSAKKINSELFKNYFHFLLNNGVYIAPSPFESSFVSKSHSKEDIEKTVTIIENWAKSIML